MRKGIIFNIQKYSVHDGPGIRTAVFLKGCALSCWWCSNPEGLYGIDGKERGVVNEREISVEELVQEIEKDRIFYDISGGGVTFSGGEPLGQAEFLEEVIQQCKDDRHKYHVALDTTGYAPKESFLSIAGKVDLLLYDLKLIDSEEHKKYTGVSNELILENLMLADELACEKGKRVIIRYPVVPGITDTDENVQQIKEFMHSLKGIKEINLLPYHNFAESKYEKLCLEYKLKGLERPSEERMLFLRKGFEDAGFKAKIGG